MAEVTLRVLDGADRGRVYEDLETPITIGREEGNSIQLNDERVSRFHVKIQEDAEKIVLTDLESTNGTKVNGEEIQLRVLRFGDMLTIGRSVIVYGATEQVAERLARLRAATESSGSDGTSQGFSLDYELSLAGDSDMQATLHTLEPPELPERLTPVQAAQVAELIEYLHIRLRQLLETVQAKEHSETVKLDFRQWQNLLDMQEKLAQYLRQIGEPPVDENAEA